MFFNNIKGFFRFRRAKPSQDFIPPLSDIGGVSISAVNGSGLARMSGLSRDGIAQASRVDFNVYTASDISIRSSAGSQIHPARNSLVADGLHYINNSIKIEVGLSSKISQASALSNITLNSSLFSKLNNSFGIMSTIR